MAPAALQTEYTIKSANDTLPLVGRIVADIVSLADHVSDTRQRLSYLTNGRRYQPGDEYFKEISNIQELTDEKSEQLQEYQDELLDLNIDPTPAPQGYADFPARRSNREICLCWKLGDPQVMYWHDTNEDCSRRRLVDLPLIEQSVSRQYSNPA